MNELEKPSWEVVITTSQSKRTPNQMAVHIALFKSLWVNEGMDQDIYENYFMREITKQEDSHKHVSESAAEWLWSILESGSLKMLRFASGKYLNDSMEPEYDEFVDVDVSMVLEQGSIGAIVALIDKMIQYNRKYIKFIGGNNESKIRTIQP